jgi:pimeloyl-ACP methyl ester carboxylesterase
MSITRREVLRGLGAAGTLAAAGGLSACATDGGPGPRSSGRVTTSIGASLYYEVHGNPAGPNLFLATPLSATSHWLVPHLKADYLKHFVDRYNVLLADYPYGTGKSGELTDSTLLTVEQVCADYLALADAAGMKTFAIAGYSWGGNSALHLATRSDRVSALAVGGWPALGGPYVDLLALSRKFAGWWLVGPSSEKWVTYYESVQAWPEQAEVAKLAMPRLNYVDAEDDSADMITHFRRNRAKLDELGWKTQEVASGSGHRGGMQPEIAGPLLRAFFDASLAPNSATARPQFMSPEHVAIANARLAAAPGVRAECAKLDRDYRIAYVLSDGPGGATVHWQMGFDRGGTAWLALGAPSAKADVTIRGDYDAMVRASKATREGKSAPAAFETEGDPGTLQRIAPALVAARAAATVDVEFR